LVCCALQAGWHYGLLGLLSLACPSGLHAMSLQVMRMLVLLTLLGLVLVAALCSFVCWLSCCHSGDCWSGLLHCVPVEVICWSRVQLALFSSGVVLASSVDCSQLLVLVCNCNDVCLPELRDLLSGSSVFRWCELSVGMLGSHC
jgi:hypothetical protein